MLTPGTVLEFVTADPCRPFRMHMARGRTFDVGHPESVKVGRSSITVYAKSESVPARAERWQEVSMMLLESIEPMENLARQKSE